MKGNLFEESDLSDLFAELASEEDVEDIQEDKEMEAAQRRYQEIIKKHKDE